jgi:putative membrane protein
MGSSLSNYLSLITVGIGGLSILAGLFFIKKGNRKAHKFFMINASIFILYSFTLDPT